MSSFFDLYFDRLLEDRDVILFDQRGVGLSEPSLECREIEAASPVDIDIELTNAELAERYDQALIDCHARLIDEGFDLSGYNSAESAADLDDLRRFLGYGEWNLYGISYGTKLALTAVRDYPEGIRSVILDSAYPLEASLPVENPANVVRALRSLFDACKADVLCELSYPNLESEFIRQLRRLDDEPAAAEVTDPYTLDVYDDWTVDGYTLFTAITDALYDETTYEFLPLTIHDVSDDDYALLGELISLSIGQDALLTTGAYYSVQCYEEAPFASLLEAQTQASRFPAYAPYLEAGFGLSV